MKAQLEIISPAVAKNILERNTLNRKISRATVERYAADMRHGRWINNGQPIVTSATGELLDGQHRLHAVVASQTAVAMMVVTGVPREAFVTMDSGKTRTLGDVLSIEGHVHTNTLAAVARSAYSYIGSVSQSYNPTKQALNDFVSAHPYAAEAARYVGNISRLFPKGPLASVIFLGNAAHSLDDEAVSFVEGVVYGEGLRRGDARHTLREWLAAERVRGRGAIKSASLFAATGRAWNAYASGKELAVIKGINAPTQRSLPIFGFNRSQFPDVPDLVERAAEVRRTNLTATHTRRQSLSAAA